MFSTVKTQRLAGERSVIGASLPVDMSVFRDLASPQSSILSSETGGVFYEQ